MVLSVVGRWLATPLASTVLHTTLPNSVPSLLPRTLATTLPYLTLLHPSPFTLHPSLPLSVPSAYSNPALSLSPPESSRPSRRKDNQPQTPWLQPTNQSWWNTMPRRRSRSTRSITLRLSALVVHAWCLRPMQAQSPYQTASYLRWVEIKSVARLHRG